MTENNYVPIFTQNGNLKEHEEKYLNCFKKVMEHGRFINGPEVKEFEDKMAKYVGTKHAIGVSSGTDALQVSLMALNLKDTDEVITVSFTWISTAEVIKLVNAKPVFCEIDSKTFNMDPNCLKDLINENTKVIIPVSIFGQPYNVKEVKNIVEESERKFGHKIYIIEDAAQSFGSLHSLGKSGSLGDIGCTSFFPTKPLGCFGDGGMCFTNDGKLALKIKKIKSHGCIERYRYEMVGLNARLDTLQASFLLSKLPDLDESIDKRNNIAKMYNYYFTDKKEIREFVQIPHIARYCEKSAYAQYTIKVKDEKTRDNLVLHLKSNQIGCGLFYPKPLHLVRAITTEYKKGDLPVTENIAKKVLSLPMFPDLKEEQILKVIETVFSFFGVNPDTSPTSSEICKSCFLGNNSSDSPDSSNSSNPCF